MVLGRFLRKQPQQDSSSVDTAGLGGLGSSVEDLNAAATTADPRGVASQSSEPEGSQNDAVSMFKRRRKPPVEVEESDDDSSSDEGSANDENDENMSIGESMDTDDEDFRKAVIENDSKKPTPPNAELSSHFKSRDAKNKKNSAASSDDEMTVDTNAVKSMVASDLFGDFRAKIDGVPSPPPPSDDSDDNSDASSESEPPVSSWGRGWFGRKQQQQTRSDDKNDTAEKEENSNDAAEDTPKHTENKRAIGWFGSKKQEPVNAVEGDLEAAVEQPINDKSLSKHQDSDNQFKSKQDEVADSNHDTIQNEVPQNEQQQQQHQQQKDEDKKETGSGVEESKDTVEDASKPVVNMRGMGWFLSKKQGPGDTAEQDSNVSEAAEEQPNQEDETQSKHQDFDHQLESKQDEVADSNYHSVQHEIPQHEKSNAPIEAIRGLGWFKRRNESEAEQPSTENLAEEANDVGSDASGEDDSCSLCNSDSESCKDSDVHCFPSVDPETDASEDDGSVGRNNDDDTRSLLDSSDHNSSCSSQYSDDRKHSSISISNAKSVDDTAEGISDQITNERGMLRFASEKEEPIDAPQRERQMPEATNEQLVDESSSKSYDSDHQLEAQKAEYATDSDCHSVQSEAAPHEESNAPIALKLGLGWFKRRNESEAEEPSTKEVNDVDHFNSDNECSEISDNNCLLNIGQSSVATEDDASVCEDNGNNTRLSDVSSSSSECKDGSKHAPEQAGDRQRTGWFVNKNEQSAIVPERHAHTSEQSIDESSASFDSGYRSETKQTESENSIQQEVAQSEESYGHVAQRRILGWLNRRDKSEEESTENASAEINDIDGDDLEEEGHSLQSNSDSECSSSDLSCSSKVDPITAASEDGILGDENYRKNTRQSDGSSDNDGSCSSNYSGGSMQSTISPAVKTSDDASAKALNQTDSKRGTRLHVGEKEKPGEASARDSNASERSMDVSTGSHGSLHQLEGKSEFSIHQEDTQNEEIHTPNTPEPRLAHLNRRNESDAVNPSFSDAQEVNDIGGETREEEDHSLQSSSDDEISEASTGSCQPKVHLIDATPDDDVSGRKNSSDSKSFYDSSDDDGSASSDRTTDNKNPFIYSSNNMSARSATDTPKEATIGDQSILMGSRDGDSQLHNYSSEHDRSYSSDHSDDNSQSSVSTTDGNAERHATQRIASRVHIAQDSIALDASRELSEQSDQRVLSIHGVGRLEELSGAIEPAEMVSGDSQSNSYDSESQSHHDSSKNDASDDSSQSFASTDSSADGSKAGGRTQNAQSSSAKGPEKSKERISTRQDGTVTSASQGKDVEENAAKHAFSEESNAANDVDRDKVGDQPHQHKPKVSKREAVLITNRNQSARTLASRTEVSRASYDDKNATGQAKVRSRDASKTDDGESNNYGDQQQPGKQLSSTAPSSEDSDIKRAMTMALAIKNNPNMTPAEIQKLVAGQGAVSTGSKAEEKSQPRRRWGWFGGGRDNSRSDDEEKEQDQKQLSTKGVSSRSGDLSASQPESLKSFGSSDKSDKVSSNDDLAASETQALHSASSSPSLNDDELLHDSIQPSHEGVIPVPVPDSGGVECESECSHSISDDDNQSYASHSADVGSPSLASGNAGRDIPVIAPPRRMSNGSDLIFAAQGPEHSDTQSAQLPHQDGKKPLRSKDEGRKSSESTPPSLGEQQMTEYCKESKTVTPIIPKRDYRNLAIARALIQQQNADSDHDSVTSSDGSNAESGSESDEDSDDEKGKPFRLVVKGAPLLRLENVTVNTRSGIPEKDMRKKKKWGWGFGRGADGKGNAESDDDDEGDRKDGEETDEKAESLFSAEPESHTSAPSQPGNQDSPTAEASAGKSKKKNKKKKKKKVGIAAHLGKNIRKVTRHGDEVSVGTMDFTKKQSTREVIIGDPTPIYDACEEGKRSHPWLTSKSIRKASKRSSAKSPFKTLSSSIEEEEEDLKKIETFDSKEEFFRETITDAKQNAKSSELASVADTNDESDLEERSNGGEDEQQSQQQEAEEKEPMPDEKEEDDGLGHLLVLSELEEQLTGVDTQAVNFEDMWDTASCDMSIVLEFERSKRKKNRDKEKKRRKREKEKEERANAARRLRLFEKKKEREGKYDKTKGNQTKLSDEFIDAIHKVFDDGSINSFDSVSESDTDVDDTPDDMSPDGSFASLYLDAGADTNDENSDLEGSQRDGGMEKSTGDDLEAVSTGDHKSKASKSRRSKASRRHGENASVARSRSSKAASNRKKMKRSKRAEVDASDVFLAEVEKLKKPKALTIQNLRQEMVDRRGTSVNLLKKEYVTFKKRKSAAEDELHQIDFGSLNRNGGVNAVKFGKESQDIFSNGPKEEEESNEKRSGDGLAAKLSRWATEEGVTDLDDLATIAAPKSATANIFGVAANTVATKAAALKPTNQDLNDLARDASKNLSSMGKTISSNVQNAGQHLGRNLNDVQLAGRNIRSNIGSGIASAVGSGVGHGLGRGVMGQSSHSVGRVASSSRLLPTVSEKPDSAGDMNMFTATFSDMPLSSIQEVDDDDDFGLLASLKPRGDDDDDNYSYSSARSKRSFTKSTSVSKFHLGKMPSMKAPKIGKTMKNLGIKMPSLPKGGKGNNGFSLNENSSDFMSGGF